jgi:hypothetical protein
LVISHVYLSGTRTDYYEIVRFFRDNFQKIIDFIRHLPVQDIRLLFNKARLDLVTQGSNLSYITADLALQIKDNGLFISGAFGRDKESIISENGYKTRSIIRGLPLRCNFRGTVTKEGLSIEKLELKRENIFSQLWGNTDGNIFRMHGYTFINTFFREVDYLEPALNFLQRANIFLRGIPTAPEYVNPPFSDLNVLDIDFQVNLKYPRLEIERLNFSLNNIPISITGGVDFAQPISLDLVVSSTLAHLEKPGAENFKKIELALKGTVDKEEFKASGRLNLDFVKQKKSQTPLERIEFTFGDLNLKFLEFPVLKMYLREADIFCHTDSNDYKILVQYFNSIFDLNDPRFKYMGFNSRFYDGFLKGKAVLDWKQSPPKITSDIRIKGVSANRLEGVLIHFSKVFGKLDSQMRFSSYPHLSLKGGMAIRKGYIMNFEFFKWLADFFNLPSLKRVDFGRATTNFTVNEKGASLLKMRLESQDVNVKGYFGLGQDSMVSSKLFLSLSRRKLKESPKFTPVLRLVSPELNSLSFDFQLSGNLNTMNFQWLESTFKNELQDAIPGFIQRKIERTVEEAISTISAK